MGAHGYDLASWVYVMIACLVALAVGIAIPTLGRRRTRHQAARFR